MKNYVDSAGLQEYTNKLIPKLKTIFPGAPLVAATAAAMTDHAKVYVYTGSETGYTAGNWYYWDGTAWASGGVYNSTALTTDTTLSVPGMAADAKVTGDDITDLKNALDSANHMFSDLSTLLSNALTDGTETVNGVEYTLTGNKLHCEGTTNGNSVKVWVGSTSSIPSFIVPGKTYIFDVAITGTYTGEVYPIRIRGKTTDNTTTHNLAPSILESGKYIVKIPENTTACRIESLFMNSPTTVNMDITCEISNAYSAYDLLGLITTNTTNISALSNSLPKYFALSYNDAATIPDNSDFDNYTTEGTYKITNNTHAATMSNIPAKVAGKLVVMTTAQAGRIVQWYIANNTTYNARMYQRFYDGTGWTAWQYFVQSERFLAQEKVVNKIKNIKIKYESGSFNNGNATERIAVYIPATNGYIMVHLYHFIVNDINCNTWRVYHIYHVDDNLENQIDLSVSGEWECAVHLAGRDDFSGGSTHGDEIMTASTFLVDGSPVDITSYTSVTNINNFTLIRATDLYDPNDHTTVIAKHGVKYLFDAKNKMIIDQSITWTVSAALTNCFLAMFLPKKTQIDRAVANSDFVVCELPSAADVPLTSIVKNKSTAITMWDTSGKFSANVSIPVYPTGLTDGDQMSIADNGGGEYNKVYFKVCGGGSSTVGELWKSITVYDMNYSD